MKIASLSRCVSVDSEMSKESFSLRRAGKIIWYRVDVCCCFLLKFRCSLREIPLKILDFEACNKTEIKEILAETGEMFKFCLKKKMWKDEIIVSLRLIKHIEWLQGLTSTASSSSSRQSVGQLCNQCVRRRRMWNPEIVDFSLIS